MALESNGNNVVWLNTSRPDQIQQVCARVLRNKHRKKGLLRTVDRMIRASFFSFYLLHSFKKKRVVGKLVVTEFTKHTLLLCSAW